MAARSQPAVASLHVRHVSAQDARQSAKTASSWGEAAMKITRSSLLKASPFIALIAGFAGGALAVGPMSQPQQQTPAASAAATADPYLQLVQAQPLTRATPSSRGEVQLSFAAVAARAGPAVVNVYAQRVVRAMSRDPFFGRFSAPR